MKTSITKLKSSFLLSLAFFTAAAWSKPVAQVIEVKGQVFVITAEGATKSLKVNDHVEEKSEVMVGEDGDITLNDYYDATYHMTQGSHLKFFNKSVQLKRGKTWVQSLNARHPLVLTTANGHVDFWKGEFITTFDQNSSKTQILVVNGEVEVSNVLDKNVKQTVSAGTFTMLDPESENGLPRSPTRVGLTSLNSALAEFKGLPQKMREVTPATRSIASVDEVVSHAANVKKGEIVFMTNGIEKKRFPASVSESAHKYFKKKVGHKKTSLSAAPIRIYGMSQKSETNVAPRRPASVAPIKNIVIPTKVGAELNIDPEFSNSLRLEQGSQPNHSKELESLINDLKSY